MERVLPFEDLVTPVLAGEGRGPWGLGSLGNECPLALFPGGRPALRVYWAGEARGFVVKSEQTWKCAADSLGAERGPQGSFRKPLHFSPHTPHLPEPPGFSPPVYPLQSKIFVLLRVWPWQEGVSVLALGTGPNLLVPVLKPKLSLKR